MLSGDTPEVEFIFDQAVTVEDPKAQRLLLDRLCGSDIALRDRVDALLVAYEGGKYLELPLLDVPTDATYLSLIGQIVDHYEVLDIIGDGGMGEVYLARDSHSPNSLVALKVIKPGMDSRQILARFELEKTVLRSLEHPAITRYFDAGYLANGRAYFSMELVRGLPITEYCDRHSLCVEQRINLFREVCLAVDHAHQSGIVHRDLKPSNIMVAQENGQPVIKVIDFGIAKALTPERRIDTRFTHALQFLGTPSYTSPEQFGCSFDVDARTDVYSLGAMLFELLAGSPPRVVQPTEALAAIGMHQSSMVDDLQRPSERVARLSEVEAVLIAKQRGATRKELVSRLRRDLDWVVLKALERDRSQRYSSATELASDLMALLQNRPTLARAPTRIASLLIWSARHKTAIRGTATALAICAAIAIVWLSNRTARQAKEQLAASDELRDAKLAELAYKEFTSDLRQVADALQHGSDRAAHTILQRYNLAELPPECEHFAFRYLQSLLVKPSQIPVQHESDLLDMDVSPHDLWMATSDRSGDIVITDLQNQHEVRRLHPTDKEVTRVRFSPDGKLLASVGQDRTLRIWRTESWEAVNAISWHDTTINGLAWSPTGEFLATGDRAGHVCIWDLNSGKVIRKLPMHTGHVRTIAWSPDGKHLATADGDVGINLWSTSDWKLRAFFDSKKQGALALAFSRDNRYLACGGYLNEMMFVDLQDTEMTYVPIESHGGPWSLEFSADDELLAGLSDGTLRYFELSSNTGSWTQTREIELTNTRSHLRRIKLLSQQHELLVGNEQGREVMRLPIASVRRHKRIGTVTQFVGCLKEQNVLLGRRGSDQGGAVYDTSNGRLLYNLGMNVEPNCRPCYSSTLGLVAVSGWDEQGDCVSLFDPSDWKLHTRIPSNGRVNHLSISQDGSKLILCCEQATGPQNATSIYNPVTRDWRGLTEHFGDSKATAEFSPTRDLLAYGAVAGRRLLCLDANSLETIASADLASDLYSLHWPLKADFVLVGEANHLSGYSSDLKTLLWSIPSPSTILALETSPDHRIAACFHADGQIRLWDLQGQKMLYPLPFHGPDTNLRLHYWLSFIDPSRLIFGGAERSSAIEFSTLAR